MRRRRTSIPPRGGSADVSARRSQARAEGAVITPLRKRTLAGELYARDSIVEGTCATSASVTSADCSRRWDSPIRGRPEATGSTKHSSIPELVNVQDVGGEAKPYQIRQVLRLVERYNLRLGGRW